MTYTDPQAAAVGSDAGRFHAMVPVSELPKTATYTRAYADSNGFLTLLSDGERLTGAYALGPEAGEWLQQATLAIRGHVPLDVLRRHDPAVPDVLGDLRRSAEGAPGRDRCRVQAGRRGTADGELGLSLLRASGCPSSTLGPGGMAEPTRSTTARPRISSRPAVPGSSPSAMSAPDPSSGSPPRSARGRWLSGSSMTASQRPSR